MNQTRESVIRRSPLALPLLFVAVWTASFALGGSTSRAAGLVAWIGAGPRVINDGFVGGNVQPVCCNGDKDGVTCPGGGSCGDRTYHGCTDGQPSTGHEAASGTASYCGKDDCPSLQWCSCETPKC